MLIDVHAHFYSEHAGRNDWEARNAKRLEIGARIGIAAHVGSVLGSWGARSPTYFPSPDDVTDANRFMLRMQQRHAGLVFGYCVVNPNYPEHAIREIQRGLDEGMVGIKLAASRRATDPLLDPIAELAAARDVPILHHVWQHRRRDWPGQEASDGRELVGLARRHPHTRFLLAHLGGGGDWAHTLRAVRACDNVWVDLSGSGVDTDMLHRALEDLGVTRLVFGSDLTMDTAWAKLRYIESLGLSAADLGRITHGNAQSLFAGGTFDGDH